MLAGYTLAAYRYSNGLCRAGEDLTREQIKALAPLMKDIENG